MPDTSKTRRANAGSFRPGPDSRRHRFTRDECSTGFWAALASYVEQGGEARNFLRNKFRARGQAFTPRGRRASR